MPEQLTPTNPMDRNIYRHYHATYTDNGFSLGIKNPKPAKSYARRTWADAVIICNSPDCIMMADDKPLADSIMIRRNCPCGACEICQH